MTPVLADHVAPWEADTSNHPLVKTTVKSVARAIFSRIASGDYPFGTRIATERELATEFAVTRTVVRQALEFLEAYKVIARRPNSGTFVTYQTPGAADPDREQAPSQLLDISAIAETASPFEMGIMCSILEPEMVRLASLYMSARDLAKLRTQLEEIERIVADAETFADLEKRFLMTIAEGTYNRLFITMYGIVTEVRRQPHWRATRIKNLSPERIVENQKKLRSLYDALEGRDIESAVEFMKLLISGVQEEMIYTP